MDILSLRGVAKRINSATLPRRQSVDYSPDVDADIRTSLDQRFASMHQRFDAMDQHFEAIDQRFEGVDRRFDAIDLRLE